ncbi:zinc-ribbon domain-containing protein [Paragemmobacter ruber]|uniref:Zinc finger/thioredoxin putative domain-containing protein n=1 Tax=Paragemmobacter ruber TaxID=1985673 RepID=A0ABW9Y3C4_9RHOB|nr:zinc-ribbon domain-containing protein [Rhodobacter ruber]NBE07021.1 hypothetical protein [Rhodobacter ruber]
MRLICPNCEAEYEVDDAAIPDTGRDVQCSNCGHAWFQLPPEIELALEQEDELFGLSGAPDPLLDEDEDNLPPPATAAFPEAEAPKRSIDENLMAILREEAEREAAARKAEAAPIETQTEMGLDAPAAAAVAAAAAAVTASAERSSAAGVTPSPAHAGGLAAAARRIAQLKGLDPDAPPPAPPKPATRRDLLPDIEEINSSLKGAEPPVLPMDGGPDAGPSTARGFRSGFAVAVVFALILLAVYVAAPRLVAMVPVTEGAVTAYVAGVDGLRLWLDGVLRSATEAVREVSAQGN